MDDETLLLCSGNPQRLLLDLNALGYRVQPLPQPRNAFATFQDKDSRSLWNCSPGRYCPTRGINSALQQATGHRRPILVSGETGTGKEVFARALCEGSQGSFPVIHCQAMRWAATEGCCSTCVQDRITTALRDKPTVLMLDEVGDLGPECQRAVRELLATIDHENTRLVVTSNRPIEALLEQGDLLPDFVEDMDLVHVRLMPLRDQPADIPVLLEWFLGEANSELGTSVEGFAPPAIRQAIGHDWPGNAREMRNTVFRSVLQQPNGWIESLPFEQPSHGVLPLSTVIRRNMPAGTEAEAQALVQQFERELLQALSELHAGNKSRIARALGVSRNTLKSRLRGHNL